MTRLRRTGRRPTLKLRQPGRGTAEPLSVELQPAQTPAAMAGSKGENTRSGRHKIILFGTLRKQFAGFTSRDASRDREKAKESVESNVTF